MPKKRGRKRSRNFVAIPFQHELALSTLAANTVIASSPLSALTEDLYIMSIDSTYVMRDGTAGEGPLDVGWSHGDYTVAEIGQALDSGLSGPGTKIEEEQSRRLVRLSGTFHALAAEEALNNGTKLRTKLKFIIEDGQTIDLFVVNRNTSSLTSGTSIEVSGTIFGVWLR